jgi:methionine aminopeptidase
MKHLRFPIMEKRKWPSVKEGMVIAIEPMVNLGTGILSKKGMVGLSGQQIERYQHI